MAMLKLFYKKHRDGFLFFASFFTVFLLTFPPFYFFITGNSAYAWGYIGSFLLVLLSIVVFIAAYAFYFEEREPMAATFLLFLFFIIFYITCYTIYTVFIK